MVKKIIPLQHPVAGMSGSVGLKETDGEMHKRAVQAAKQSATKLVGIRLSPPDFDLNVDLLLDQLQEPCLLIIDNPNNPTGKILLNRQAVASIVENTDALLVAGETFIDAFSSFYVLLPRASLFAASAAMQNPSYMSQNVGRVIAERKRVWSSLKKLAIQVYPCATNSLLAKTDIPDLVRKLDVAGIQTICTY